MHRPTLVVVGLLLAAAPAIAQKPEEVEEKILELVNAYRAKKDAPKLLPDEKLTAIAQEHARGMAKADKFGDKGNDGRLWQGKSYAERVAAAKYPHRGLGENVGRTQREKDPAAVMVKVWLNSAVHEKNIANKEYTRSGLAAAKSQSGKWYFVHLFAKPPAVTTRVTVTLDNKTKQTISFRIGTKQFELKAGEAGELMHETTAPKAQLGVKWPGGKKEETFDLADKGNYAFTEKEEGKFAFEKVESK